MVKDKFHLMTEMNISNELTLDRRNGKDVI